MSLPQLSAAETRRRVEHGQAVLIDIREPDEHAREFMRQPVRSLSQFEDGAASSETLPVVFHCQSGNRTAVNSDHLGRSGAREMFVMAAASTLGRQQAFPPSLTAASPAFAAASHDRGR